MVNFPWGWTLDLASTRDRPRVANVMKPTACPRCSLTDATTRLSNVVDTPTDDLHLQIYPVIATMENPHEAEQAVLLERIIKNVVRGALFCPSDYHRVVQAHRHVPAVEYGSLILG